jgi:type IV pilus assembly protein PilE
MRKGHALRMRSSPAARVGRGVTLLELLVVIALISVLMAIAVPTYSSYIVRGQRSAAKAALMQSADFLERNYTTYGTYSTGASAAAVTLPNPNAPTDGSQITYALSVTFPTAQSYLVTATPCGTAGSCPAGSNSTFTDTDCGALALDNTGAKTVSGALGVAICWQR